MRFLSYLLDGEAQLGVRVGEEIVRIADIDARLPRSLEGLLALGTAGLDAVTRGAPRALRRLALAQVTHLPPLTHPGKIVCVGLNYAEHAAESLSRHVPGYPELFCRFAQSFVGHGAALQRPSLSQQFDYEGELVAVIGRTGRHIPRERSLEHVAGYTIFNDGSIRDYQRKGTQWTAGKNFDRTGACGPELVTADELPPGASGLRLQTHLNGTLMQNASTREMIFDVAALVAICSDVFELRPGDMIVTGTPAGVGVARKPPVFMVPGDVCQIDIESIGTLRNPIEEERAA